ncbi:MAG: hypothetical protein RL522_1291 [Pseudomonadota bacterium]|jgi:flagella basal body P-ring formation protein FlgA
MNSTVSKTHHALPQGSQSLCPAWSSVVALVMIGLVSALPDAAAAQAPTATAAAARSVTWPAAATPELALTQAVTQWLGAQQRVDPASIRLAPLDPRLQIRPCTAGLQLDHPFASQETVRVRCESPTWQLFVRTLPPVGVNPPQAAARPAAASAVAEDKSAALRKVVVTSGLLQRGTRLSADQVSLVDLPAQGLPANVLDRVDDVLNAEVLRDIPAGTPLRTQDIRPALMVRRGQLVMVSAGSERGFRVVARLEALQDGRMGEQIKLKNRESGRQISGVITGMNTADAL